MISTSAIQTAWTNLSNVSNESPIEINSSANLLQQHDLLHPFCEFYLERFRLFLKEEALASFWQLVSSENCTRGPAATLCLANAVDQLADEVRKWLHGRVTGSLSSLCPDLQGQLFSQLKSSVFSRIPANFHSLLQFVYSYCFRISRNIRSRRSKEDSQNYCDDSCDDSEIALSANGTCCGVCGKSLVFSENSDEMNEETDECEWNREEQHSNSSNSSVNSVCNCGEILEAFDKMNAGLRDMGLQQELVQDAVTSVLLNFIETYVTSKSRGNFTGHSIDRQLHTLRSILTDWLTFVYKDTPLKLEKSIEQLLIPVAYEIFAAIRIEQLFDMIVEFPDSSPAIEDLRGCLQQCFSFRSKVVDTLRLSFEERLLHPGVATNDILTAYIQTIKALRLLDPTGVLLQLVCDPLKSYLKGKSDTVRCIITALTDENSELIPELVKGVPSTGDEHTSHSDDEAIVKNWQSWKPDPVDAARAPKGSKSVRSSDIVSILVDVYDSKDMFVEEYQRLLSQRFLTAFDCNADFERRNLELLTLKFGESDLHACEVMLQDMTSSKRIDSRINSGEIANHFFRDFAINCIILSSQFWPEKLDLPYYDEGDTLILPSIVEQAIDCYTKAFETIKGNRTLQWKKNLGKVDLTLEFGDRSVSLLVTPLQAATIYLFQDKSSWKLNELASATGVSVSLMRRKLIFWQNKGILREFAHEEFVLVEDQSSVDLATSISNLMELDAEESIPLDNSRKEKPEEDKFRIYWSYIENMLTNLSDMTLEKIHSTLQMFALQGTSSGELTLQELRQFLERKTRDGKLTYSSGYYRLAT